MKDPTAGRHGWCGHLVLIQVVGLLANALLAALALTLPAHGVLTWVIIVALGTMAGASLAPIARTMRRTTMRPR